MHHDRSRRCAAYFSPIAAAELSDAHKLLAHNMPDRRLWAMGAQNDQVSGHLGPISRDGIGDLGGLVDRP